MPTPTDPAVRQAAFAQCAQALRRTLATTPLGWGLIFWICHGQVALASLLTWLGVFAACWAVGLMTLRAIDRAGPDPDRHARALLIVAALDGIGWGAMSPLLMGGDAILNAWLSAILCGVAAVNAPVYLTWFAAYGAQTASIWLLAALGQLMHPDRPAGIQGMVGLTVFLVVITSYLRPIAARIVEGIRLQFANADLTGQLRGALEASRREAETDALTGLPNRRALAEVLQAQLQRAGHQRIGFAVLMLDLDHFKAVNDNHGHAVGDQVLQAFAARVRETLRDGDVCARHGGEEFVVVLPGATLDVALAVAERLRTGVSAAPLPSTPTLAITVSIGAAAHASGEGAQDLLARADTAVYEAKRAGRNRVCAATPGSPAA